MLRVFRRLRARLKYRHFERDLAREIEVHRAMKQDELEAGGLAPDQARRRSWRELGNVTYMREESRRVRLGLLGRAADQLLADVMDGMRSLRRSPAFSTVALCVLALGIGLNTAIFSVAKAVFLPFSSAESPSTLVYISSDKPLALHDFRAATQAAFQDFAKHGRPVEEVVIADTRAARRHGEHVSASYFDVIGVTPSMGRTFSRDEDDPANPARAMVISHDLWAQLFDSDPAVIGRSARIGANTFTVIGVMPSKFRGLSAPWRTTDFWITSVQAIETTDPSVLKVVTGSSRRLVARLRPGVSLRQASAIASVLTPVRLLQSTDAPIAFADDGVSQIIMMIASAVMGVGLTVLLIAGINITGIISARAVSREREFAVRQALGAGGWRVIQQRLLEGLLLATGGGVAGTGVAWVCLRLYRAYSPAELVFDAPLDVQVLAFTSLVCLCTGLLIGLAPALRARKPELLTSLGGVGAGIPRRHRRRLQYGVLIPQILLSIVLLIVGGVYGSTLMRMEFPDPGYKVNDVTVATYTYSDVPPPGRSSSEDYPDRRRAFDSLLLDKLNQAPGVSGAALSTRLPSDHMGTVYTRWIATDANATVPGTGAEGNGVSTGYFSTLGIPLLRGRDFDRRDVMGAPAVAIISESLAKQLWPDADPLGRSFVRVNQDGSRGGAGYGEARLVVGVVADTRSPLQKGPTRPAFYTALWQTDLSDRLTVFIVASGTGAVVREATRAAIEADPMGHVLTMQTIEETIARQMYPFRAAAWLLGVSGVAGLLLAALGLYGVIAYSVAQQTREFGIRATLGARSRDLTLLVLKRGGQVATLAAVPGVLLGLLTLRMATRFSDLAPSIDPLAIVALLLFIAAVVITACYLPARRAGRVDPVGTLRAD
jgi:putative ABC transport system permease protein